MGKPFTISSKEAADFDAGKKRVTDLGGNATQTEWGARIDPSTIDAAVARSGQAMPEPLKKK